MSVRHSTKITHVFAHSKSYLKGFFDSITCMLTDEIHTDMTLITNSGAFHLHQIMLVGRSKFLADLILRNTSCQCEDVTVFLPDFEAQTVKNLLNLLYTGTSIGDCTTESLKTIIDFLQIDISCLSPMLLNNDQQNSSYNNGDDAVNMNDSESAVNDCEEDDLVYPGDFMSNPSSPIEDGEAGAAEAPDNEVLEVTPQIQAFLGNHFMMGGSGESESEAQEEAMSSPCRMQNQGVKPLEMETTNLNGSKDGIISVKPQFSMEKEARRKAIMNKDSQGATTSLVPFSNRRLTPYGNNSTTAGSSNYGLPGGSEEENKVYFCRLCSKSSSNGASLFAHFLYPHYGHLWRNEIPHRVSKYSCKKCTYTTSKRQHFVMHVARVHDELRTKLAALGENLEVLDNLTIRGGQANPLSRIISKIAKCATDADQFSPEENYGTQAPLGTEAEDFETGLEESSLGINYNRENPLINMMDEDVKPFNFPSSDLQYGGNSRLGMGVGGLYTPRGVKPFVKCRLCGKAWKGKDNFFTHLVSTHFKYLWAEEVPRSAALYVCHVYGCNYQSKYRYNFLFHLAGKHKQLKDKLAREGVPLDVLTPIEVDLEEFQSIQASGGGGPSREGFGSNEEMERPPPPPSLSRIPSPATIASINAELLKKSFLMRNVAAVAAAALNQPAINPSGPLPMQIQQQLQEQHEAQAAAVQAASNYSRSSTSASSSPKNKNGRPSQSNTKLLCRVCQKVSLNHTCHRQHMVGKHFHHFWAHHMPDQLGVFNCDRPECTYKTPNRSVFIIHLAYVHSELKSKLLENGHDPEIYIPDVFGKRKYRRTDLFDNGTATNTPPPPLTPAPGTPMSIPSYRCVLCNNDFAHYRNILEHLALTHLGHAWDNPGMGIFYVDQVGPYTCQKCNFNSSSRSSFVAHMASQHEALNHFLMMQYGGTKQLDDFFMCLPNSVSGPANGIDSQERPEHDQEEEIMEDDDEEVEDDEDMGVDEDELLIDEENESLITNASKVDPEPRVASLIHPTAASTGGGVCSTMSW